MSLTAIAATTVLLSTFAPKKTPWVGTYAYSEQSPAMSIGSKPCDFLLQHKRAKQPQLLESLRVLGEHQAKILLELLGLPSAEFEAWPTQNDDGQFTWVFARYRANSNDLWQWIKLPPTLLEKIFENQVAPILVSIFDVQNPTDQSLVFDDFLKFDNLYQKPLFGDCIWTEDGKSIVAAWLSPHQTQWYRKKFTKPNTHFYCYHLPQPARFHSKPISFVIQASDEKIQWPENIQWLPKNISPVQLDSWPNSFQRDYRRDVLIFSGEKSVRFPISERKSRFVRKNSSDPENDLETLIGYLEERYKSLGITTQRYAFKWRGIPQSNLIAKIPGKLKGKENKPVILTAHFDTAFKEDIFAQTGNRVATHGANDNATATAAVLQAAEILRHQNLQHDVWLVHLTGEEFPADCLGARQFVDELLRSKQQIGAAIVLDMIGHDTNKLGIVQIHAGDSDASARLAEFSFHVVRDVTPKLRPFIRLHDDEESFLYNTDGLIFSNAGYPVILLNEAVNRANHLRRRHYHTSTDVSKYVSWSYATAVTKAAIEIVFRLAR